MLQAFHYLKYEGRKEQQAYDDWNPEGSRLQPDAMSRAARRATLMVACLGWNPQMRPYKAMTWGEGHREEEEEEQRMLVGISEGRGLACNHEHVLRDGWGVYLMTVDI